MICHELMKHLFLWDIVASVDFVKLSDENKIAVYLQWHVFESFARQFSFPIQSVLLCVIFGID